MIELIECQISIMKTVLSILSKIITIVYYVEKRQLNNDITVIYFWQFKRSKLKKRSFLTEQKLLGVYIKK